jgi:hypothetical protein
MPAQDAVRNASKSFYSALNSMAKGDATPMLAVWAHSAEPEMIDVVRKLPAKK